METFVVRVWVPAVDPLGAFPGTESLHGMIQHVGGGPEIPFAGVGQLLTFVHGALAERAQQKEEES